jgi:hypothetical protein
MANNLALTALNVAGFQAVWLCCVAGAGRGLLWPGLLAAALFAALTLAFGGQRGRDLRALILLLPLGIAVDSVFAASGWLAYAMPVPSSFLAPAWIVALWVGFILTLNHSLGFLRDRPWLAALFGLVGGPLAYSASARVFDAVDFGVAATQVLLAVALAWALFMPVAFALLKRDAAARPQARPA